MISNHNGKSVPMAIWTLACLYAKLRLDGNGMGKFIRSVSNLKSVSLKSFWKSFGSSSFSCGQDRARFARVDVFSILVFQIAPP